MRIALVISSLSARNAGPASVVLHLAQHLRQHYPGLSVHTVREADELSIEGARDLPVFAYLPCAPRVLARSTHLKHGLLRIGRERNVVFHGHGLWELPVHYAAVASRGNGCPLVITPHGMLEPWALKRSRWKKRLAGQLFQNLDLRSADCLHALAHNELQSFRDYGLKNPVAVVSNGIDIEDFADLHRHDRPLQDRFPVLSDRRFVLFLGRIHPKKGLLHLAEAWAKVQKDHSDWLLVIAGPDQGGHRAQVEEKVRALEVEDSVLFPGPLYGDDKMATLAAANFFVLPSFSEGFSMAVLEAMAARSPVLITPGCNFPEVEQEGAGLIVEAKADAVKSGLGTLMELSDKDRRQMGARGRRMVEEHYTWDKVAAQMTKVYEWLLGQRERPDCVVT